MEVWCPQSCDNTMRSRRKYPTWLTLLALVLASSALEAGLPGATTNTTDDDSHRVFLLDGASTDQLLAVTNGNETIAYLSSLVSPVTSYIFENDQQLWSTDFPLSTAKTLEINAPFWSSSNLPSFHNVQFASSLSSSWTQQDVPNSNIMITQFELDSISISPYLPSSSKIEETAETSFTFNTHSPEFDFSNGMWTENSVDENLFQPENANSYVPSIGDISLVNLSSIYGVEISIGTELVGMDSIADVFQFSDEASDSKIKATSMSYDTFSSNIVPASDESINVASISHSETWNSLIADENDINADYDPFTETNAYLKTSFASNDEITIVQPTPVLLDDTDSNMIITDFYPTVPAYTDSDEVILRTVRSVENEEGSLSLSFLYPEQFSKSRSPIEEEEVWYKSLNLNPSKSSEISQSSQTENSETSNNGSRKNNPSVDDIISGIIQLLGGNVRISRPQQALILKSPVHHQQAPLVTRINNRGPPRVPITSHRIHSIKSSSSIFRSSVPFHISSSNRILSSTSRTVIQQTPTIKRSTRTTAVFISKSQNRRTKPTKTTTSSKTTSRTSVSSTTDMLIVTTSTESTSSVVSIIQSSSIESSSTTVQTSKPLITNFTSSSEIPTPSETMATLSSSVDLNSANLEESVSKTSEIPSASATLKDELLTGKEVPEAETSTTDLVTDIEFLPTEKETMPTGPVTDWVPVFLPPSLRPRRNSTNVRISATSEPVIITQPSIFDLTVTNNMGGHGIGSPPPVDEQRTDTMDKPSEFQDSITAPSDLDYLIMPTRPTAQATSTTNGTETLPEIVYGKPTAEADGPIAPSFQDPLAQHSVPSFNSTPKLAGSEQTVIEEIITLSGSGTLPPAPATEPPHRPPLEPQLGRPVIIPVDIEEVRPVIGVGQKRPIITEPGVGNDGSVYIDGRPTYLNIRPTGHTQVVGMGVSFSDDPARVGPNGRPSVGPNRFPSPARRPPVRPRPNTPLVRIDTCIIGDSSTCDSNLNEYCRMELGISSCHCRPGFARSFTRGPCVPIVSLILSVRVDRMGEKPLNFHRNYLNPNTEDYQILEYEALQAIISVFSYTNLARQFMGAAINKFYSTGGKLLVNATIQLEENEKTKSASIRRVVQQEVASAISGRNLNIGDSSLYVDGSLNPVPLVEDLDECGVPDLHDCSKHGHCENDFGTFHCVCNPGFLDKHPGDQWKAGRYCAPCSPEYCNNHGDCVVENSERLCRCRGNYIGSRCEIDGEVLGVALGASLAALVIIIVTFVCLCLWNRRWKRDQQQKTEAMSAAGSGQTFSYLNKASNGSAPSNSYRLTMEDRMRWAQIADAVGGNIYVQPDPITGPPPPLSTPSQHIYAAPSRIHTPDPDLETQRYGRLPRPKSRGAATTSSGYYETDFSTREICNPAFSSASPYLSTPLRPFYN